MGYDDGQESEMIKKMLGIQICHRELKDMGMFEDKTWPIRSIERHWELVSYVYIIVHKDRFKILYLLAPLFAKFSLNILPSIAKIYSQSW